MFKSEYKTIVIKSWTEQYEQLLSGREFDIRKNDRNYKVGDIVTFREFDHKKKEYTGRWMDVIVKHVHTGALPCLAFPGNMCVFQFVPILNESRPKNGLRIFKDY